MLAEIGQIALVLAFILSGLQVWFGLHGAYIRDRRYMALSERAAIAQGALCLLAFAILVTLFMTSDFSVKLVAAHSHTSKPMLYKFSGTWGNHEGSMLLWVLIMTLFGACMVWLGQTLPATLRARALAVQGLVGAGFIAFLIFTSNPFERLLPAAVDGVGLNPLLQDPGLAFHPPFLYVGYVGFSVAFSFAVAALIEGRVDALWARWVRPWVLLSWSFLTIGIAMGSLWAYYELGWGGWWFWDPVENVSFMPWLAGTALLHSTLVAQARGSFVRWTLLLAITTFSLSLVGTFIVRSGVLTSVHAFAVDPDRGVFILGLLILSTGGALALYALRSGKIEHGTGFELESREASLALNNILIVCATATVFLGTFYPLIIDAVSGNRITVGPPYFNMTFAPIMSVLIIFMAVGPLLKWRSDSLQRIGRTLAVMAICALIVAGLTVLLGKGVLGAIGLALAAWLIVGSVANYAGKIKLGDAERTAGNIWRRWRKLPSAAHGFLLAHVGLAVTVIGITGMSVWATESVDRIKPGEAITISGYSFELRDVRDLRGPNYVAEAALIDISRNGQEVGVLQAERRFYPVEQNTTTEGAMNIKAGRILFAALGEGAPETGWIVRVYYHPLVIFIWTGALIMAFGGFVSLADRRFAFVRKQSRLPTGQPAGV
ncbi:MAG: heme lyase CcmF/NrfE family subunit [Henriciella sp.]